MFLQTSPSDPLLSFFFLWHPCSAPLLLCCSTTARRFRPPLATSCCPSPPRVAPSSSAALASSLLASLRLPRHFSLLPELPPSATAPPLWKMPAPPPSTHSFLICPWASSAQALPIPFLFLCRAHPEHQTPPPPPSSTPTTLCSPWAAAVRLPLPTTTPWAASPHPTDTPRPLLVVGFPPEPPRLRYLLAGEFLFPLNPSLRPFSVQSNHPSSFLSSCCS
jgi:hypothetical protein